MASPLVAKQRKLDDGAGTEGDAETNDDEIASVQIARTHRKLSEEVKAVQTAVTATMQDEIRNSTKRLEAVFTAQVSTSINILEKATNKKIEKMDAKLTRTEKSQAKVEHE